MKLPKPSTLLIALAIAVFAAFAGYRLLQQSSSAVGPEGAGPAIGEVASVTGQAERRAPESIQLVPLDAKTALLSREMIVTHRSSEVTLRFETGAVITLAENTRVVSERDSLRSDGVIATVLEGDVTVVDAGIPGRFRLFKNGRETGLAGETKLVPSIPSGTPNFIPGASATPAPRPGLIISALQGEDPIRATGPPNAVNDTGDSSPDVLTNEDIIRQLRAQTGFFQRCYLTFINRNQPGGQDGSPLGPTGVVTVTFIIQSSGRVTPPKIVRTEFEDAILHKCILDVIERTRFKSFQGDDVPVLEFPIQLQ